MLKKMVFSLICIVLLTVSSTVSATNNANTTYFKAVEKNRFMQGVCSDGSNIYATTDQDVNFKQSRENEITWDNNNIISVYDMNGNFIKEKKNIYGDLSSKGLFMSFGDCSYIDGDIYATVYDRVEPFDSRVLVIDKDTLRVKETHDIGNGLAEGVDFHDGFYWVVYHSHMEIRKFDSKFNFIESYPLTAEKFIYEAYQGLFWIGDDVYMNMHGPNLLGQEPSPGMDHYHFTGTSFEYIERVKPPTYGAGQGIEKVGNKYLWIDRPMNRIVITDNLKVSRLQKLANENVEMIVPTLLNGWTIYDTEIDRAPKIYKDQNGFVHLEGMMKGGSLDKATFILPKGFRPKSSKNFAVAANDKFGRIAVVGNDNPFQPSRAGEVLFMVGENNWVSLDGISFLADSE